jgi:hypothetical protein
LTQPTRSTSQIIHHALDVKTWLAAPPTVEAARPPSCPCGVASREPGRRLGLHGHGLRERQVRGPVVADGRPLTVTLVCRRYRCTACATVVLVVPRGVAPRRHYGFAAIAMALTLWLLVGEPIREVRRRVCAWQITRESTSSWSTLRRWRHSFGDRFAQRALGRAPPHAGHRERAALAFAGGAAMP